MVFKNLRTEKAWVQDEIVMKPQNLEERLEFPKGRQRQEGVELEMEWRRQAGEWAAESFLNLGRNTGVSIVTARL